MKNRILFVFLMIVSLMTMAYAHQGPTVGPLPIDQGGTAARTAAAARTALGVGAGTDLTTHELDQSTHGATVLASATALSDHEADNSSVHGCTAVASATALSDHEIDNSAVHGCTVVASQTAVETKAPIAGLATQSFTALRFVGPSAMALTNGETSNASAGSLVSINTTSGEFIVTPASGYPDGILFADTAAAAEGVVFFAGPCTALVVLNATAGDYLFMDDTTRGAASTTVTYPASHPQFIGRVITTTTTGSAAILFRH